MMIGTGNPSGRQDPPQHPPFDPTQEPSQLARGGSSAARRAAASGHVLARVPITAGGAVPVRVTKERVPAVSQAVGAVARRLAALDALAHEMDPLVSGRVSSVFLALRRHRVAQGSRLLGQPLDLRRSTLRPAILTTDVADGFEVGEQFVEEAEQFRQHG
jgi:hypothetical protein